jgi:hypothetical protein
VSLEGVFAQEFGGCLFERGGSLTKVEVDCQESQITIQQVVYDVLLRARTQTPRAHHAPVYIVSCSRNEMYDRLCRFAAYTPLGGLIHSYITHTHTNSTRALHPHIHTHTRDTVKHHRGRGDICKNANPTSTWTCGRLHLQCDHQTIKQTYTHTHTHSNSRLKSCVTCECSAVACVAE